MRSPLWTNATHQGQPSKLSEKKKPTEAVFSEENEVFTEGEKETTLYKKLYHGEIEKCGVFHPHMISLPEMYNHTVYKNTIYVH